MRETWLNDSLDAAFALGSAQGQLMAGHEEQERRKRYVAAAHAAGVAAERARWVAAVRDLHGKLEEARDHLEEDGAIIAMQVATEHVADLLRAMGEQP
jgi:hypothetical protein